MAFKVGDYVETKTRYNTKFIGIITTIYAEPGWLGIRPHYSDTSQKISALNVRKINFKPVKFKTKDRWINLCKIQGWKYKETSNGKLAITFYNQNRRVTFFVQDHKIQVKMWSMIKSRFVNNGKVSIANNGSMFMFIKKNGLIRVCDRKNGLEKFHLDVPHAGSFYNAMMGQLKPRFGSYKPNDVSERQWMKLAKVFKMFFGINKIPFDYYNDFQNDLKFKRFIFFNKYPNIAKFNNTTLELRHPYLKKLMKKPDVKESDVIKYVFGSKSKKFKKLYYSLRHPDSNLYLKRYLIKRFNKDKFYNLVSTIDILKDYTSIGIKDFKLLDTLSDDRLYNMLLKNPRHYLLEDAVRQYNFCPEKYIISDDIKSFQELHDSISRQYRRFRTEDYKFNEHKDLKAIDGTLIKLEQDEYKVIIPKTRHELVDWGENLSNCIAGYHESFHQKKTKLIGIEKNNELKYAIEINRKQLRQFFGKNNSTVPQEIQAPFLKLFKQHKLVEYI